MGVPHLYNINNCKKENEPRNGKAILCSKDSELKVENKSGILTLRSSLTPAATRVPRLKLNNGLEIPSFGFGTSKKSDYGQLKQVVEDAIDAGYRHIDCAFSHLNESEIGEAIKEKICQGVVKRGDLFIASKLWNTFHHPDQVEKGVRRSLDALGLEYLDIYLIHWPKEFSEGGNRFPIVTRDTNGKVVFSDADICDTWKAMEQLVRRGLVKSIGVSNFNQKQLVRLLSCVTIRPAVIRTEILPYTRYRNLVNFCRDNGIVVTAYSSLTPSDSQLEKEPTYLDVRKLLGVSKKYDKSVAQVILRWTIQKGMVVVPKSADNSKLAENLNIFDFYLTEEEMDNVFETNSNINDSGTAFL